MAIQHLGLLAAVARTVDHSGMKKLTTLISIAAVAMLGSAIAPATGMAADPNGPPDIREVYLSHVDDGSARAWEIDAQIRRATSVRFRTRFAGRSTTAPGRQVEGHSRNFWIAEGGHDLLPLVRESLDARGYADVGFAARGPGGRDRVKVRFLLADCHMDPPFYPLSCSAKT